MKNILLALVLSVLPSLALANGTVFCSSDSTCSMGVIGSSAANVGLPSGTNTLATLSASETLSNKNIALVTGSSGAPALYFTGDPSTGFYLNGGFNGINFLSHGVIGLTLVPYTNGVNYLQIQPAATGIGPSLSAIGADTNINLGLVTKGTTGIVFVTGGFQTTKGATIGSTLVTSGTISQAHTSGDGFCFNASDTFTNNGVTTCQYGLTIDSPATNILNVSGFSGIGFSTGGAQKGNWTNSGLSIGIGSTASQSKLDVYGNVSIGTSYAGVTGAPTNGMIVVGSVGIGTASPLSKLSVVGLGTTSPGSGGGYVCSDSTGNFYVKSTCP